MRYCACVCACMYLSLSVSAVGDLNGAEHIPGGEVLWARCKGSNALGSDVEGGKCWWKDVM